MTKEGTRGNKKVSASAALVGGLMIAALSFTAGIVGAGSHRIAENPNRTSVTSTQGSLSTADERVPSDQGYAQKRVPGHSECDLQWN